MMLRKRLCPKTFTDFGAVVFLIVMVQVVYWFDVFLVLPQHYEDSSSWVYYFHFVVGTWLMFNIVGNFVMLFLLDTSIRGRFMAANLNTDWRYCTVCEALVPPRSWHCSVCDVCILKRDHHCNFTACCIGHENHRYFLMFIIHLFAGTLYASYFNIIFLYKWSTFSLSGIIKLIFPMAMFIFGNDMSMMQLYRMYSVITIVGMIAAGSLAWYHLVNLKNGQVMHERVKNIKDYDTTNLEENIKQVFGKRWYLTWISPFFTSSLPSDGIHWDDLKKIAPKSK